MVAQTRHGGQTSPQKKLAFREKLVGKGLSTDALLKKLKTLHNELAALDQDHIEVNSLDGVRKELIHKTIFLHKDRGVKAYAACCLADILRLYAPDAPYTQLELKDIFNFFFVQLTSGLQSSDVPYYNEYFHLLESLSTVKSVVLVCDLPSADEHMVTVFKDFFTIVKRDLAKKIEIFMADILIALIDECQSLPSEVLEIILAQFVQKSSKFERSGHRLAVQVCNAAADKLQRHVCQYFTDIIVANSEDESFEEIRTAHELIKRLHHSCPGLLHSVIPQLEEELRVEDVTLRGIATQVLGEMYADKGADLVKKYPSTWNMWVSRKNDKAVAVRLKFVEASAGLLTSLPEVHKTLEASLHDKILDPDEKVRAAVCKVYSQLDYEAALHHASVDQLRAIAGRGLDKKQSVRVEALNAVGKLYSIAYPEIENNDPSANAQFAWIPDEILPMTGVSHELRSVVEQVVANHILPLPTASTSLNKTSEVDEVAWTDRLLITMGRLSEKSINALLGLSGLKAIRPTPYDHFLDTCIKNNGGTIDENAETIKRRLALLIQHLASAYPEPHKASEDLNAFAKLNENRLYKLMKTCLDTQTDLKSLVKATSEFEKRLEQLSAGILPTMTTFLRRASCRILNQSSIPTLIKRVQKGQDNPNSASYQAAHHAQTLLTFISKHSPSLYKLHISELTKGVADEKHPKLVEVSLQALAGVVRWDDKLAPTDKRTNERVVRLALQSDARHAKFAARFLAFSKNKEEACTEVIESISEVLKDEIPENTLVARIAVLAQISRFAPDAFEAKSDVIMAFLLKKILMVPSPADEDEMDDGEEWVENDDVPDMLRAKILSLKVCRNRSLAHASAEKALEMATPVLKMLATILEHRGSLTLNAIEDPKFKSRMRLQAAISLFHLSTVEKYAVAITPKFLKLAVIVQACTDTCYNVRITALTKLITLLQPRKLIPRYNVIPFLTVHDPEMDVKNMASSYVTGSIRKMPPALAIEHFQLIFVRLLHLLAHHPDFNTSHDDLLDIAKYVQFYLDLVATSENVSLLYHLAMKGKTVIDAEDPSGTNFYFMCELAQHLIKSKADSHSWSIPSWPGKLKLPSDILRPPKDPKAANNIVQSVYLPSETLSWLGELSKTAIPKEKKERKPAAVKRKAPPKTHAHANRRRRKNGNKWNSDESSGDEDTSGTSDVERVSLKKRRNNGSDNEKPSVGTRTSARTRAKVS
ncbi:armadillo-type protein [Crucibulum laeve]|uniref:Armadillo-type protein n=1 Tax=Crucibulum laeve TaxID=68775 RepID=A0A5C3MAZ7_9AGAR|nr:armadillo-type protein [Crucibulum laeve]